MGDEGQPARSLHLVNEQLRVMGERSEFSSAAKDQQVIFLRVPRLIVNFLTDQHEDLFIFFLVIAFKTLNQYIVIGYDHGIHTCRKSSFGDVLMRSASIRVACMHMQIDNDFRHTFLYIKFFPLPSLNT